jgi:hypothetical protein
MSYPHGSFIFYIGQIQFSLRTENTTKNGAETYSKTTLSITTLCPMTISIFILIVKLIVMTNSITTISI